MPRYDHNIKDTIYEEDVYKMWRIAKNDYERILIALLWITGARDSEIAEIKRGDIDWTFEKFRVRVKTKKLGEEGAFYPEWRILDMKRPYGVDASRYIESIIIYCKALNSEDFLILCGTRWMRRVIRRLSKQALGKPLCLMHFRHSVMTHLGATGQVGLKELQHWKGSRSVNSVIGYLSARPYTLDLEIINRSRELGGKGAVDFSKREPDSFSELQPEHKPIAPVKKPEEPKESQPEPVKAEEPNPEEKKEESTETKPTES